MKNYTNKKIAIIMLACKDYEAMELSLACHMKYLTKGVKFFILQNCRGNYDAERTLEVAKRYENLYPDIISVIDEFKPNLPYYSILKLLKSDHLRGYKYICKVDDDAFPIADNWIDKLSSTYFENEKNKISPIAYTTPLINNNCWAFPHVMDCMNIKEEYFDKVAIKHKIGSNNVGVKIIPQNQISTGEGGTIWRYPHIARWIHKKTTLKPDLFISATKNLGKETIPNNERYSIGCIFFKKDLWFNLPEGPDDEAMIQKFCSENNLKIICDKSIPFIHLSYFTQREENRDIIEEALAVFNLRLNLPYPIALKKTKLLEIESRLRWLEEKNRSQHLRSKLKLFFNLNFKSLLKKIIEKINP